MRNEALCWAFAAAFGAGILPAVAQSGSDADGDAAAAALVGDQVREQGFACADPVGAERDPTAEDDAVWTLTCADAKYRVRLVPDQAAKVEKLD